MRRGARRAGWLLTSSAVLLQPMAGVATTMHAKLTTRQKAEQTVSRLTFGATPGEVDAVERMGLDRWLRGQMHPERMDDGALEGRLAEFPAIRLSTAELLQRLPTAQRIRQMVKRDGSLGEALPGGTKERLLYAAQIAGEREKLQEKTAVAGGGTGQPVQDVLPQGEAEGLVGMAPAERWGRLMAMRPEQLLALSRGMNGKQRTAMEAGLTAEQRETVEALGGSERVVVDELMAARMLRDIASRRELQAVMTDFWLNHFNVSLRKKDEPFLLPEWERVIREHALGHFEDLLQATAHSPAMLEYLDNEESVGPHSSAADGGKGAKGKGAQRGLNENYARELMELHTLGVACEVSADRPARGLPKICGGGYTQADVTAAAAVLTGWGVEKPERAGAFQFEPKRHEPGAKVVLGETIPEGGEAEGMELLHRLATSPATGELICRELAVRFVSDVPPQTLVDRMARRWAKTHGDVAEVLWTMAHSPEFYAGVTFRAKVKTPEEFVISAARATGAQVTDARGLVREVAQLGMPLYGMPTPQGYDWTAQPWVNTGDLLGRMNFALRLAANKVPGTTVAWPAGRGTDAAAMGDAERRLEGQLMEAPVSDALRGKVLAMASGGATGTGLLRSSAPGARAAAGAPTAGAGGTGAVATMAGLLLGSPDFQRR